MTALPTAGYPGGEQTPDSFPWATTAQTAESSGPGRPRSPAGWSYYSRKPRPCPPGTEQTDPERWGPTAMTAGAPSPGTARSSAACTPPRPVPRGHTDQCPSTCSPTACASYPTGHRGAASRQPPPARGSRTRQTRTCTPPVNNLPLPCSPGQSHIPFRHVLVIEGHKHGILGGASDRSQHFLQQELNELLPAVFRHYGQSIDDNKRIQTLLELDLILRFQIWSLPLAFTEG